MHSTKIPIPLGGGQEIILMGWSPLLTGPPVLPPPSTCLTSTTSRDLRYTSSRSPHVVQKLEHVADDQMVSIVRRKKS